MALVIKDYHGIFKYQGTVIRVEWQRKDDITNSLFQKGGFDYTIDGTKSYNTIISEIEVKVNNGDGAYT